MDSELPPLSSKLRDNYLTGGRIVRINGINLVIRDDYNPEIVDVQCTSKQFAKRLAHHLNMGNVFDNHTVTKLLDKYWNQLDDFKHVENMWCNVICLLFDDQRSKLDK